MSRGYGFLTVGFALVAGIAIGSNPRLMPLGWLDRLQSSGAPPPALAPQPTPAPALGPPTTIGAIAAASVPPDLQTLKDAEAELFSGQIAAPAPTPNFANLVAPDATNNIDFLHGLVQPDLPITRDPRVARYLQFFTQTEKGRSVFQAWLSRRERYQALFANAFRQQRLPSALEAVALVESGLYYKAKSPAGAAGLWQLMPATARAYGLRVDASTDERYDPPKATAAATQHLVDLFVRLRSWDLALAAYNAGTGNIEKRAQRGATVDFWQLANTPNGLPQETRLYVPKVLAVSVLLKNLATFGFQAPSTARSDQPNQDWVALFGTPGVSSGLTPPSSLISLAAGPARAGLEWPDVAPPRDSHAYLIDLGEGSAPAAATAEANAFTETYRVVAGDTLIKIATSFGVTPDELTNWNRIPDPSTLRIGQVLRVHPRANSAEANVTVHLVSNGETLSDIARRFGVTEAELARKNRLADPGFLREGQILKVQLSRANALSAVQER